MVKTWKQFWRWLNPSRSVGMKIYMTFYSSIIIYLVLALPIFYSVIVNQAGDTPVLEYLFKDMATVWNLIAMMIILAGLLAGMIGLIISRKVVRPLRQLIELMKLGSEGDLSIRAQIRSKDEIGFLSTSFNQMVEQLNRLVVETSDLSQKVMTMSSELSEVAGKNSMAIKEVSAATEQIASGASTLAMDAEKGNELSLGIRQQMQHVMASNVEMGQSADEVRKRSMQGADFMNVVIDKTRQSEEMTRTMVDKVAQLKENTQSIHQILEMLDHISKQTNILSLNAAIEASRAGEAGKGFMVVADEIRKLADQSKQSIGVVAQITDQIRNEIDTTAQVLEDAYPIFQEQTESVEQADAIFKNVSSQMEDFINKLEQVTDSLQQLDESQQILSEAMTNVSAVSQQSSATTEEVASLCSEQLSASEGLVKLSNELEKFSYSLKQSLEQFKTS